MTATITTIEQAIDRVVFAARLRWRELEVRWRDERGRWDSPQFQAEHEQLAAAIATVEAGYPSAKERRTMTHSPLVNCLATLAIVCVSFACLVLA